MNKKISEILSKIEDNLDNLQEQGKLQCWDKVEIVDLLDEINELI